MSGRHPAHQGATRFLYCVAGECFSSVLLPVPDEHRPKAERLEALFVVVCSIAFLASPMLLVLLDKLSMLLPFVRNCHL
jgi:hypothetical protein